MRSLRLGRYGRWLALVVGLCLPTAWLGAQQTVSAVPGRMLYQGFLTDDRGAPLEGEQTLTFALYADDTALWFESQTVTLTQGRFSVMLGRSVPIAPELFSQPLVLGVQIGGAPELVPRQPLSAVPYAFAAVDAERLEGRRAVDLDQSAHVSSKANPHKVTAAQVGAPTLAAFEAHLGDTDAHPGVKDFADLEGQIAPAQLPPEVATDAEVAAAASTLAAAVYSKAEVDSLVSGLRAELDALRQRVVALESGSADVMFDGALRREGNTLIVEGVNLVLRNGSGATESRNGLGNLIIGYDEGDVFSAPDDSAGSTSGSTSGSSGSLLMRDGSHNIVLGTQNDYRSWGGIVGGQGNRSEAPFAVVLTGNGNVASGGFSAVVGGGNNLAEADFSAILGGALNKIDGIGGTIAGGEGNRVSGVAAVVAGGNNNVASGRTATVLGGNNNESSAAWSAVVGGSSNRNAGSESVIVGGAGTEITDSRDVQGTQSESPLDGVLRREGDELYFEGVNIHLRNGSGSSQIVNGLGNLILGYNESRGDRGPDIRTGSHNLVGGRRNNYLGWGGIVTGEYNTLDGDSAALIGGRVNTTTADADWSAIVSGNQNIVNNVVAAAVGGLDNAVNGNASVIVGGRENRASDVGDTAVIVGGYGNESRGIEVALIGGLNGNASGTQTTVVGGRAASASGLQSVAVGGLDTRSPGEQSTAIGGVQVYAGGLQSVALGGNANTASGAQSVVLGGTLNIAGGDLSATLGGSTNRAQGNLAAALAGYRNTVGNGGLALGGNQNNSTGIVLGGQGHQGSGIAIGGRNNSGVGITIGGDGNVVDNPDSMVLLGSGNRIGMDYAHSLIAAALGSVMLTNADTETPPEASANVILGGADHRMESRAVTRSVIVGGESARMSGARRSAIVGGVNNRMLTGRSDGALIAGGANNADLHGAQNSRFCGDAFVVNRSVLGRLNFVGDAVCQP